MDDGPSTDDGHRGTAEHDDARHEAGVFDIRNVIAALIGVYGIVLIVMGLVVDSSADREKTGDVNANLWAGIGLVVFAVAFVVWTRLRPVVVAPSPGAR